MVAICSDFEELSGNSLTELKRAHFRKLSNLKNLNISLNYELRIVELDTFIDLKQLKFLYLSRIRSLESNPDEFMTNSDLTIII